MKKQILIVGIIVLLIAVGLSGCNEQTNQGINGIQITNVEITTHWQTGGVWAGNKQFHEVSGFYHDYPVDSDTVLTYYLINGTVINNAGELMPLLYIYLNLYDANNNVLRKHIKSTVIHDIPNTYSETFHFEIKKSEMLDYFDNVENYKFEVSTSFVYP